jgi:uncharacterized protein
MLKKISIAVALAFSSQAYAVDNTFFDDFTPLTSSAGPIAVGSAGEATPITLSNPYFSQVSLADRANQNALVPGSNSGAWDMIDADATGRYLFMPFETGTAGVQRVDLQDTNYNTRTVTIVAPGTQDFVAGDASRITPWGGYLTAEESWGAGSTKGRLFELTNPTTATATTSTTNTNFVQRSIIPRVSHEGLAFDNAKSLYFIDELNGGSIYKYVSNNANASNGNDFFASGQTFAAKVNGGNNANAVGGIVWEAITDINGGAIAGVSTVLADGTIDGRVTANTVGGTDYQRPEDMELQIAANGDELLYITTTTTNEIYAFNLTTNTTSVFANQNTIDLATGLAVGSSLLNPDNLAIDANGNIYIIEDRNGGVDNDIWFAKDINKDGDLLDAGEGLARWASNGTQGSEFTGMYFSKTDPNVAFVNIQHPTSGNDRLIQITATAPVPEPETYAMLLAGLGLIGATARRRKS